MRAQSKSKTEFWNTGIRKYGGIEYRSIKKLIVNALLILPSFYSFLLFLRLSWGFNRIEVGTGKNFFPPSRRKGNFCRKFFKAFRLSGLILVTIEQHTIIFFSWTEGTWHSHCLFKTQIMETFIQPITYSTETTGAVPPREMTQLDGNFAKALADHFQKGREEKLDPSEKTAENPSSSMIAYFLSALAGSNLPAFLEGNNNSSSNSAEAPNKAPSLGPSTAEPSTNLPPSLP